MLKNLKLPSLPVFALVFSPLTVISTEKREQGIWKASELEINSRQDRLKLTIELESLDTKSFGKDAKTVSNDKLQVKNLRTLLLGLISVHNSFCPSYQLRT